MSSRENETLEDLLGDVYIAQLYPKRWDVEEFGRIDAFLLALEKRIEARISRTKNRIRLEWLQRSIEMLSEAASAAQDGNLSRYDRATCELEELLKSGNKAHRRKTRFVVAPDGTTRGVEDAQELPGQAPMDQTAAQSAQEHATQANRPLQTDETPPAGPSARPPGPRR